FRGQSANVESSRRFQARNLMLGEATSMQRGSTFFSSAPTANHANIESWTRQHLLQHVFIIFAVCRYENSSSLIDCYTGQICAAELNDAKIQHRSKLQQCFIYR